MKVLNQLSMEVSASPNETYAGSQESAFTQIVNTHLNDIYSYARYMIQDTDDANDMVQKTFLSLYQNLGRLDLNAPIKPWLFRVARNHCLDYLKKKKAVQFSAMEDEEQVFEIPDTEPSVENRLDDQLFQEQFRRYVDQLPVAMKEVLLLKYFEDLTFEQIADLQGQPVNTVKSHFYRGKEKLYKFLVT